MAEKSGFYPSTTTNPRTYGNTDMNMPYKKLIRNGVFASPDGTPSDELQVQASEGLNVVIKAGNGIFRDKWYENTTDMVKTISQGVGVARTDYIVVRCDENENEKRTYILVKTGDTTTGAEPELIKEGKIYEYLLAKIHVPMLGVTITQDMIEDCRGTADCPWITSLINQVDTSTLWMQFNTAFWNWFNNLRENLTTTVMLTQKTAQYLTVSANQKMIAIPESLLFNINLDILNVYIEGRKLIQDVDYIKDAGNIELTLPLPVVGTKVEFEVIKNIDASNVEEYVERLYNLETIVNDSKATSNQGSFKITVANNLLTEFMNAGVGLHTFYCPANKTNVPASGLAFRGIGHITSETIGWILAISHKGDVYINYNNANTWTGWKILFENTPTTLWTGTYWMTSNHTVNPTKRLSQCKTGWQLLFSGYENSAPLDNRYVVVNIPKIQFDGTLWNGQLFYAMIPVELTTTSNDGDSIVIKGLYISDGHITGHVANQTGNRAKVILRAVYEY